MSRRRLMVVVNDDFGSLGEALYFLRGAEDEVLLLLPERLFALNRRGLGFASRCYASPSEICTQVDQWRPHGLLLYSAYLIMGQERFDPAAFDALISHLERSGAVLATSDPFLNIWRHFRDAGAALAVYPGWQQKIIRHYLGLHGRLISMPHIYPVRLRGGREGETRPFFNPAARLSPAQLAEKKAAARAFLSVDGERDFWLFFLSALDLQVQQRAAGTDEPSAFQGELARRLRQALASDRIAVLVAPESCLGALPADLTASGRFVGVPHCGLGRFDSLLHGAEYCFAWNRFSFVLMPRVLNAQPIFILGRGHLDYFLPGFSEHARAHYYRNCEPPVVGGDDPLTGEWCRRAAEQQAGRLFGPFLANIEHLETPQQVLAALFARRR